VKRGFGTLLLFLIFMAGGAFAGKHPVPLDPKADPKTCLECHSDKTEGKSVHSAMAMGCTTCHESQTNDYDSSGSLHHLPLGQRR
jgi:hypothetical protein